MSHTPRDIGTLIVVILKARNLPNKRHIGKQDPYCTITYNDEKRRTKAIKRGGQHPEWDEEVRFTLLEDVEDELARTANGADTPPPPPPKDNKDGKDNKFNKKIKGGKSMRLYCYADDPREPDLIGETTVDLSEVLSKGETDEWFTLMSKDRYAGEIYLELTFWSNEPAPRKKVSPKPSSSRNQYGGPGSFVPTGELPSSLAAGGPPSRSASASIVPEGHHRRESLPPSLRASNSLAKLDLYVPPYEQRGQLRLQTSALDQVIDEFAELGVGTPRGRSESFPPLHSGYQPRSASASGLSYSESYSHHSHGSNYSDGSSFYDRPLTPTGNGQPYNNQEMYATPPHAPMHQAFDPSGQSPSGYPQYQSPSRHPRYSIPTASSGFMPIATPAPSGFVPLPSHPSDPSGFVPAMSQTPAPYPPPSATPMPSGFAPMPSHTPAPSGFMQQQMPMSSSPSYHASQPASSFAYQHYNQPPPASAPPQQHFIPSQPPISVPPPPHSAPPQQFQGYPPSPSSPGHDQGQPGSLNSSLNGRNTGSRPLPQPQFTQQAPPQRPALPVPPGQPGVGFNNPIPPPPPLPQPPHESGQPYHQGTQVMQIQVPPPPPPPPSHMTPSPSSGRPSLPQPPTNFPPQQPVYQPILPPPPPPNLPMQGHPLPGPPPPLPQPPTNSGHVAFPGPPPRPPAQINASPQWYPTPPQPPPLVGYHTSG
ncbi:hypothetical protein JAAARDRAFT_202049 [Jaapia argillacea MUCL 33604]|uniref:C2 domain-containing protein n=1 Tax=Jaapia argillacea MUCL 33604 TaxID=933084 RepID=A0A067QCQ4_9AGAM|nr:hypothetical protein JAAARDRAFT_202049 [Jaapia argillacea MUCL 33604]